MTAFLADKWIHVLVVALCAAAAASAAGVDSSMLNALFTLIAGGTGAHAGATA